MKISTGQIIFIVILTLCTSISYADILFQDDFEGKNALRQRVIDETKWMPVPSWKLSDNADKHEVLGRRVLDIWGERAQFDNIVVTTPGFLSVEPKGKLSLTWGELKRE